MNELEVMSFHQELVSNFVDMNECTIAVSGGVDSMTLAAIAHSTIGNSAQMIHAVSPAVPKNALDRIRKYATRLGWNLIEIDACEMNVREYRLNPINRCYFCKTSLYKAINLVVDSTTVVLSGTNIDDLSDYRPGLIAAAENNVRHPYVEHGIDKSIVRKLAKRIGLEELSELPSSPCLSSRIETGIVIDEPLLRMVDELENKAKEILDVKNIRGRVRYGGVVVELDNVLLTTAISDVNLEKSMESICENNGLEFLGFATYQMGSAFIHEE